MTFINLKNIKKIYSKKQNKTFALNGIDLTIDEGDMVAIMGPSGSGKSTLLNILGLIDVPSSGNYSLDGYAVEKIKTRNIHKFRNKYIGFIFQYFALLKDYTMLDNVVLPLTYRRMPHKQRLNKAKEYIEKVGISDYIDKTPGELSGGQQQRIAIARALVGEPSLILADEPTGNLDQKTGQDIMKLLCQINRQKKTIIIVTHDINVAKKCHRIITIVDGKILET
ncbi:ABC transporter ATP-binding protein [Clostridium kluyveri]|uniref:Peptide ABC transporter ATP-binding protein n=1 Tax=Clostridium kluyveri TaxID=1534 RepID=A0A1L5FCK9_CLOKL|nr:ABC transporter ATP-binding protein [Clostridium kluyveri]APM40746.1 peptide ABC transporter ATP-binding protein [Clostridium kluyveri]UZQ49147.1 ABC transporter ATP-binding protein [Clostridium kluyveri]